MRWAGRQLQRSARPICVYISNGFRQQIIAQTGPRGDHVTQVWIAGPSRRLGMHGTRASARPPPRLNRGAGAWERDGSDFSALWLPVRHSLVLPVVTRAQVHAVTDSTNQEYSAVVSAALDAIETGVRNHHWAAPTSRVELDAILSAICDQLIYVQR